MSELKQYRIRAAGAAELVSAIEKAVAGGELVPGQRLPSVRRLAADAGLSPATVAAGLAELRRRGVVLSEPRRGTRIGQGPPIGSPRRALPVPPGARDLSRGNPDPALLPDLGRAMARADHRVRLYGERPGDPRLLQLVTQQLIADGIPAAHVCISGGALDAIERVLQAQLRPGDRVAVENPGYAALYDLLRALGLVLEPVRIDELGMDPRSLDGALERGAGAVIVTPRGQNPTGAALDGVRARQLRDVLSRYPRAMVVEDDHLGEVAGAPLHTTVTGRERWAATRSVAKALGPDLRLAALAGDAQTIARVQGRQQCGPGWVSHILQSIVVCLWTDPAVREQVTAAAATYSERRERLLAALVRHGIDGHGASGLNVWVTVNDEAGTVGALMQRGWVVAPGEPYRLAGSAPAIRVTTATLLADEAERLAADLADVLSPAMASRSG